jgi:hypothetical protein
MSEEDLRRQIQELQRQVNYWRSSSEYWRGMWSKAANRLLRVDPELSGPMTTTAEEIRRVEEVLNKPDPWKDV